MVMDEPIVPGVWSPCFRGRWLLNSCVNVDVVLSDCFIGITLICTTIGCQRNCLTSLVSFEPAKIFCLTFSLRTSSVILQSNSPSGTALANHHPSLSTSSACPMLRRSLPPGITAWIGSSKNSATCRYCDPRYDTTHCCTKTTYPFCGRSIDTWKIRHNACRR